MEHVFTDEKLKQMLSNERKKRKKLFLGTYLSILLDSFPSYVRLSINQRFRFILFVGKTNTFDINFVFNAYSAARFRQFR